MINNLNDKQLQIIIWALVLAAVALAASFLRFGDPSEYRDTFRLLMLDGSTFGPQWGLFARVSIWGVLLGIVAPIFLCAAAALINAGRQKVGAKTGDTQSSAASTSLPARPAGALDSSAADRGGAPRPSTARGTA